MSIFQDISNVQGDIGAALNIFNDVTGIFADDVVAIYDADTFEQIFVAARPMKCSVSPSLKIMDHPIETGAVRSDFAIVLPVTIDISMLLTGTSGAIAGLIGRSEYGDVFQQIKTYFYAVQTVVVQTKTDVYPNMVIEALPYEENPDMFDVLPLSLRLREVQLFQTQYQQLQPSQVENSTDQSTINVGQQQPQSGSSILVNIFNYVKGIF